MRNSAIAFDIAQSRWDHAQPVDDLDIDQETREALTDWRQLAELDNLGRLAPQIERLILAWDDAEQPTLPGHDEITPEIACLGVRMAATGDGGQQGLAAYYALSSAIAEVYEERRPPVYEDLFESARTLIEKQRGEDD